MATFKLRYLISRCVWVAKFEKVQLLKLLHDILKTKSNFTLSTTEYIFTVFDFNQIKYCNELLVPALTQFTKNNLGKLFFFRVICAFIKSTKSAFPNKIQSKPRIWTRYFKGHRLPIENTARNCVSDV